MADQVCRRVNVRAAYNTLHGTLLFYILRGWDVAVASLRVRRPDGSFLDPPQHEIDDVCRLIASARRPRADKDRDIRRAEKAKKDAEEKAYWSECEDRHNDRVDALRRRSGQRRTFGVSTTAKGGSR